MHTKMNVIDLAIESRDAATAERAFREIEVELQSRTSPLERANILLKKAVLYGVLRRFDEARTELGTALAEAPDDPGIRLQFDFIGASLHDEEGSPQKAYEQLSIILSAHRDELNQEAYRFIYEDIQKRRAFDLARLRQWRDAVPLFEECLSFKLTSSERSDLHANLGLCYLEMREYQAAKDHFLQASSAGLSAAWTTNIHFYLGIAYAYLDEFQASMQEFKICEEHPINLDVPATKVYRWLSYVYKRIGNAAQAERYASLAKAV